MAEGIGLGLYSFDKYKSEGGDSNLEEILIVEADEGKGQPR